MRTKVCSSWIPIIFFKHIIVIEVYKDLFRSVSLGQLLVLSTKPLSPDYLKQWWPAPWVNSLAPGRCGCDIKLNNFHPRPVLAFRYCCCLRPSVCPCLCVCINHLLVCKITWDPFKLGSPNLDQRWRIPWLRSLLFGGKLTLTFKVKFYLKSLIFWFHHYWKYIATI